MVVHPCPGRYKGNTCKWTSYHCKDNLSGINGVYGRELFIESIKIQQEFLLYARMTWRTKAWQNN